ncbi:hypothetical protein J3458_022151 [Metarhizium acridum]|uniref:uncharacterized protein n=1 Tax=Metarhizium acridum TaxID=92637 RepID=UPI001C6B0AD5|nr:hypothetical protein J3458_022151 [Metarhizium acridum]
MRLGTRTHKTTSILTCTSNTPYIPNGTHPAPHSVDGAQAPVPLRSPQNGGESDIDIDIVQSFILPQSMLLYQVDDIYYSSKSNLSGFPDTFLDALDGSYCHKTDFNTTGDSPGHLHLLRRERARRAKKVHAAPVQRVPQARAAGHHSPRLIRRLRRGHRPRRKRLPQRLRPNQHHLQPRQPVSCPYLTAVGATQLSPSSIVHDAEVALQTPLPGTELFASGGGFSNYFPAPEYQRSAVQSYLARHDPGHRFYVADDNASNIGADGGLYNRAGRGIPDVAANGANFRAFTNGSDGHCSELVSPHCCGAPSSP